MSTPTDEQLVLRLSEGQADALDELYSRYAKKLSLFFVHSMQMRNAEDLVHEVFLKVIKGVRKFDPQKALFRTWLFSIARNHCLDFIRHEKKVRFVPLENSRNTDTSSPDPDLSHSLSSPEDEVETAFFKMSVHAAVNECIRAMRNDEERQVLVLYYLAGKVLREIGDILGYSISSIKKRLSRAMDKVRLCLEEKGIDSEL